MGTGEHVQTIRLGDDQWAQLLVIEDWSASHGQHENGQPSLRARILDLHVLSGGGTVRQVMRSYADNLRRLADLVDKYTPPEGEKPIP